MKSVGFIPFYHWRRLWFTRAVFLWVLVEMSSLGESSSSDAAPAVTWYSKYEHYPPYCATPEEMSTREIPLLPTTSKAGETRLLQVTAVIRHGARTPWDAPQQHPSSDQTCWPGYNPIWNCDLTTFIGTPQRNSTNPGMFWMNKEYTALHNPQANLSNFWLGTCQRGQLLLQGYEQELQNGRFLRNVYVHQGDEDYGHDARFRLVNAQTIFDSDTNLRSSIYYRSDDDQRTLMSGQVVLRGLLQQELNQYFNNNNKATGYYPILPLHVADRERDVLASNNDICPRLQEIEDRYHKSPEYQAFLQSDERQLLLDFKKNVLNGGKADLDCLMTTMCTDRDLPDQVNDYQGEDMAAGDYYSYNYNNNNNKKGSTSEANETQTVTSSPTPEEANSAAHTMKDYGTNLFRRLAQLDAMPTNLLYTADNGLFSKVAMGPLWNELMHHIKAAYDPAYEPDTGDPTPAKMALFSGHDTTILPLMASLGVWNASSDFWPPYASMMIIEVHELNFDGTTDMTVYPTDYAFRLLYNGEVWTPRVPNCPAAPEQLCDLDVLLHLVKPMLQRDCSLQHPAPQTYVDTVSQAQAILETQGGAWAMGMVALASFVLGIFFTVTCVCCCCPNKAAEQITKRRKRKRQLISTNDDDDEKDGRGGGRGLEQSYSDQPPDDDGDDDSGSSSDPPSHLNGGAHNLHDASEEEEEDRVVV